MKSFLTVARREIVEWWLVLAAAAVAGWLPVIAPWLPGLDRHRPAEVREAVVVGVGAVFFAVLLLVLGAGVVARELGERRLGFYFSRPIPTPALWLGKLAGALCLLLGSLALLTLPALLVGSRGGVAEALREVDGHGRALPLSAFRQAYFLSWQDRRESGLPPMELPSTLPPAVWWLAGVLAVVLALAAVHAVAVVARARTAWLLADLAGAGTFAVVTWHVREVLLQEQALGPLVWAERAFFLLLVAGFLVAGAVQLGRGRVDPERGHRHLSLTLWPILLAGALALGGYARWAVTPELDDLTELAYVESAPAGGWLAVGGRARHRAGAATAFLVDVDGGEGGDPVAARRLGGVGLTARWLTFAGDGGAVVYPRCDDLYDFRCELLWLDLREPGGEPTATGVTLHTPEAEVAIDRSGRRLAVYQRDRVSVHELPSGKVLSAVRARLVAAVDFVAGGRLRFFQRFEDPEDWRTTVDELDPATGEVRRLGRLDGWIDERRVFRDPHGDAILYATYAPWSAGLLRTGADGAVTVHPLPPELLGEHRFLADGRVVFGVREGRGAPRLVVTAPSGEVERNVELAGGEPGGFVLGGEHAPGRLLVGREGIGDDALEGVPEVAAELGLEPLEGWSTWQLEVASGELVPLARGVAPLVHRGDGGARAGSPGTRLFVAGGQAVVSWDPATGRGRHLFGPFSSPRRPREPAPY